MMPFIGMRISWLTVARTCDLARFAASAASPRRWFASLAAMLMLSLWTSKPTLFHGSSPSAGPGSSSRMCSAHLGAQSTDPETGPWRSPHGATIMSSPLTGPGAAVHGRPRSGQLVLASDHLNASSCGPS